MRGGLADCLLAVRRDVKLVAERQPLAQFELDAAPGVGRLEAEHVPLDGTTFGRAAADHAADAVLRHEVEGALRAALDRLPAFDRQPLRRRHQGNLFQRIAAIRHLRRDRVLLPPVRKRLDDRPSRRCSSRARPCTWRSAPPCAAPCPTALASLIGVRPCAKANGRGRWTPRYETFPMYQSPLPEILEGKAA